MGTRAFSHDSIFIPDGQAESEQAFQAMSQDKILGKVKTLQQQLSKTIKFGHPPQATISERTMEEANSSLEDVLFSSPMETENQSDAVLSDSDNKLSDSPDALTLMHVPGTGHEVEEKVTPVKLSRPKRHISSGTIESINLDAVPQAVARLDNSAAKHKLSIKPKKQRLSRKHRRLTKESQSITVPEFEQEKPETYHFSERYPDDNGHIATAKPTQYREEQKHFEVADEKTKQEDDWRMHKAEEKRQMAGLEEKRHLEEQRRQEVEQMQREQERKRCEEEKKQHVLEEEKYLKIEKQRQQEEEKRQREQQRQQELEEQKRQDERRQQELEEQKRQDERRQQELEEQKRQDERRQQELEEQKRQDERRLQELEEQKRQEKFRQQELEEQRRVELEEQKIKGLEEQRCHKIEKHHQEKENRRQVDQQRQELKERREFEKRHLQAEETLQQEEEAKKLEEQSQHQKEKKKREEQTLQKLEKQKRQEEQRKHEPGEQMHLESEERKFIIRQEGSNEQDLEEMHVDEQYLEKQKEQEQALRQKQDKKEVCSVDAGRESLEKQLQEESNQLKTKWAQKGKVVVEEKVTPKQTRAVEAQEQEKTGEELRWQEIDERQAMHRPFTFQVSSGEKQIIFQKVNLSPVTPVKEATHHSSLKESKTHISSKGSHAFPSSLCVPHTAILVTGAQLCGTAVNLNQIKDTACKSLLGLTEERKNMDIPPLENTQKTTLDPKPSRSKMKYTQETNNQDILAEWASIRSRILKSAETSKLNERDRVSICRHSDDWTLKGRGSSSHGNLRKTLSANAKFSIIPAWQKFSDTSKASADAESASGAENIEAENTRKKTDSSNEANDDVAAHKETLVCKDNVTEMAMKSETHLETANNTEGYKFAKDLPSFLVPSLSHSPGKELCQSESPAALESLENTGTRKLDKGAPNEEENVSPFGIKLRRTNYSLRFHYDQQAEQKKKKRYSAGDSFDGVLGPLVATESGKETINTTLKDNTSPSLDRENATVNVSKDSSNVSENSHTTVTLLCPTTNNQIPLPSYEKLVCKLSLQQKPALAPKPTNQTPPSSPLSKMNRSNLADTLGQKMAKTELDTTWKKDDNKGNVVRSPAQNENKNEEEETREKKSFFPSITMPWREKADKKLELLRKEKPVLQSRHSLDGSKLMEKVESAQPLWITLALQKQKGFREQQATREERRQAREAKQAEKLAKENAVVSHQSDKGSNISKTSVLQKPTPQEDEKKIDMAVSRLERREQLKKSNTLPTSVTVEISDSVPSTPLAKEVAKRFSTPDANPVSTEPAWLALAKRKAKAWSDCPQIIK